MRYLIYFIFSLLLSDKVSGQQLYPVYWDSTAKLNDMVFLNREVGMVVGSESRILRTDDEGFTWKDLSSPVNENFTSILFTDSNTGYITGSNGTILKSGDAGLTWERLITGVADHLNHIAFYNSQIGMAVGDNGCIISTSDGGENWEKKIAETTLRLKRVTYGTMDTVLIGSADSLYRSHDAGKSWKHLNTFPFYGLKNIRNLKFTSPKKLYVTFESDGMLPILRSADQGSTWEVAHLGNPTPLYAVDFVNDTVIYKCHSVTGGNISFTLNGGKSWTDYSPIFIWPDGYPQSMTRPEKPYRLYQPSILRFNEGRLYMITGYTNYSSNFTPPDYNFQICKSTNHYNADNILFGTFLGSRVYSRKINSYNNLIELRSINADSTVSVNDNCISDSEGLFSFHPDEDSIYVKIYPNKSTFPGRIPTYHDSVFTIQESAPVRFHNSKFIHVQYPLIAVDSLSLGDNLNFSGVINTDQTSQVNARLSSGNPVEKLDLILVNSDDKPVQHTTTNKEGYFRFENLKAGSYRIFVDYPFVDNKIAPVITAGPNTDIVRFLLRKTYLTEELPLSVGKKNLKFVNNIYPNPASGNQVFIEYENQKGGFVKIELLDLTGKKIKEIRSEEQGSGKYTLPVELNCKGMYLIKMEINGLGEIYPLILQ